MLRSRSDLLAENALLRQQLIVAQRHVKKPKLHRHERAVIVALSAITKGWRNALLLVKPETVLRWHRYGFRLLWKWKSRTRSRKPRIAPETVDPICQMATNHHFDLARPHQGIVQLIPVGSSTAAAGSGHVARAPMLNGLHHDHRRAA